MSHRAIAEDKGRQPFRGGKDSIAVFLIDQDTGEPTLIQHADPRSYHVRTFGIDPTGQIMVAASIAGMDLRDGDGGRHVPAALTLFRIAGDGKLAFSGKYDVEVGDKLQWWCGFVELT